MRIAVVVKEFSLCLLAEALLHRRSFWRGCSKTRTLRQQLPSPGGEGPGVRAGIQRLIGKHVTNGPFSSPPAPLPKGRGEFTRSPQMSGSTARGRQHYLPRRHRLGTGLLLALMSAGALADIPALPVMTLYKFNGKLDVPYYEVNHFIKSRKPKAAGSLAQGSALIPCVVVRNGRPLTDRKGTPYVGFTVVLDTRTAGPQAAKHFEQVVEQRQGLRVQNHHCDASVKHVINVRRLVAKKSPPRFDPPATTAGVQSRGGNGELDSIVRAFHNSPQCAAANRRLLKRREALSKAWTSFSRSSKKRWPEKSLKQARQLDYVLRTALFEGHLGRGCSAYGACERNTIALSIRNRARGSCAKRQGCRYPGDFEGAASSPSQYNIWDEYLTQISGLTACYLRDDLGSAHQAEGGDYYDKLERMYAQNQPEVEQILFGSDKALQGVFPGNGLRDLKTLRHYYHAPAMGQCFPGHPRVEYMSGAIARKGRDYALIANTRIQVDQSTEGGYFFQLFKVRLQDERDNISIVDAYPGFIVDGRKVELRKTSRCHAYGMPKGCAQKDVGRYRRTPPWLTAGKPLGLNCRIQDSGDQCRSPVKSVAVEVGGKCDREMRPVAGVR